MKIEHFEPRDHGVWLGADAGQIHIQALGPEILRIRYTRESEFSRKPSLMVISPPAPSPLDLQAENDRLRLSTPAVSLDIESRTGRFTWRDTAGRLLTRQPPRDGLRLAPTPVERAVLGDLRTVQSVDGERVKAGEVRYETVRTAWHTRTAFEFQEDEAIYGLGQHDTGYLNYRGHHEYLFQQNMKVSMPMILSTRGWGVLWDSYSLACFHDDGHGSYFWTETDDELEFYFLAGGSADRVIAACRRLTGKAVLLPRWASGYVQSKERYQTGQELVDTVAEYRRRKLPLDVIVQDWRTWPEGMWGEKQFDPTRFPDPENFVARLHDMHAKLMVSIWPVMRGGPDTQEMAKAGHLLGGGADSLHGGTYDAFDAEARALYWRQARKGYWQYGIDAWWCDCTEPFEADWKGEVKPEPHEQMNIDVTEFKKFIDPEYINAFSLQHSRGLYENQLEDAPERRMLNLTRSAYIGQQRYGTVTWSGDVSARWSVLANQIPAGLNFCATGSPHWTTDIGAFFVRDLPEAWFAGGDYDRGVDDLGYRELYVRWFQYGAFLPMFRSHGTDTPREVWRFGEPGTPFHDALERFLHLRYRLLPYLYSLAGWSYHRDYTPMRPLAFDFPEDTATHDLKDQFMLGPALMACPVTHAMYYGPDSQTLAPTPRTRPVYLPKNSDWYDFWTGTRYAGGQAIDADAPLEIMPLMVRAGSILPLGPVMQYTDEKPDGAWEIRVYPGCDGRFDVYEDDGEGLQYQRGECAWTPLSWHEQERKLRIGDRAGSFRSLVGQRRIAVTAAGKGVAPTETPASIYRGQALDLAVGQSPDGCPC